MSCGCQLAIEDNDRLTAELHIALVQHYNDRLASPSVCLVPAVDHYHGTSFFTNSLFFPRLLLLRSGQFGSDVRASLHNAYNNWHCLCWPTLHVHFS